MASCSGNASAAPKVCGEEGPTASPKRGFQAWSNGFAGAVTKLFSESTVIESVIKAANEEGDKLQHGVAASSQSFEEWCVRRPLGRRMLAAASSCNDSCMQATRLFDERATAVQLFCQKSVDEALQDAQAAARQRIDVMISALPAVSSTKQDDAPQDPIRDQSAADFARHHLGADFQSDLRPSEALDGLLREHRESRHLLTRVTRSMSASVNMLGNMGPSRCTEVQ